MTKFVTITITVCLIYFGVIITSCSPDKQKVKIFTAYLNAVNQNDINGALITHARDAEFIIPGQQPINGTEELRSLLQWDSVMQSQITFTDLEVHGDTIIAGSGSESNFWFQGMGLDSISYAPGTRVVFDGKLIKGIYPAKLQPESTKRFELRFKKFMDWAMENATENLAQLMPGGFFTYNSKSAKDWLELLEIYNSELEH